MSRPERQAARALGARAEAIVVAHLEGRGYAILGTNVRVGRAEIDIVARRGHLLAFCEVRARAHGRGPHPLETIDAAKQRRLRSAAMQWTIAAGLRGHAMRFDAAAVTFERAAGVIDYVEGAF